MRALVWLCVWMCAVTALPCALRAAESAAADDGADAPAASAKPEVPVAHPQPPPAPANHATRDKVCRLLREFTAELWQERENALEQAIELGDPAILLFQEAFEKSEDPEVRARAARAIIGIREAPIRGTYTQNGMDTTDGAGNHRDGDNREGWLTIGGGKAVWCQRFGATVTSQSFHFDLSRKIAVKDKLELPLVFDVMETVIGYSPESNNPKLIFTHLADGRLKVTFMGTDGMQQTSKVSFSQKNFLDQPVNVKLPDTPEQLPAPHENQERGN